MAQVCGVLNAATGALVALVARVLETGAYHGAGIRSPEQWVAWRCGLSSGRAHKVVAMARRLAQLPEVRSALEAGQVSEDQVAVVCRHTSAHADAEVATLARVATWPSWPAPFAATASPPRPITPVRTPTRSLAG